MVPKLLVLLVFVLPTGFDPLTPVWSPDHEVLATTGVPLRFETPEGGNFTLLLNGRPVYPPTRKSRWFSVYKDQHTFLSQLVWSPDSQRLALFEKIFDWEYFDPFNSDFNGYVSGKRYYLVIVSRTGSAAGYVFKTQPSNLEIEWLGPHQIVFDGRTFDLRSDPPATIK